MNHEAVLRPAGYGGQVDTNGGGEWGSAFAGPAA